MAQNLNVFSLIANSLGLLFGHTLALLHGAEHTNGIDALEQASKNLNQKASCSGRNRQGP